MANSIMSERITQGIRIRAVAEYLPEHSNPEEDRFLFSYHITISNEGTLSAKLISRHWIIINSFGETQEVRGPGVIGETPLLNPGKKFEYTSFCPLDTNFGTMEGSYQMEREEGEVFEAEIGRFYLATTAPSFSSEKKG